jgi:hypothetical protein
MQTIQVDIPGVGVHELPHDVPASAVEEYKAMVFDLTAKANAARHPVEAPATKLPVVDLRDESDIVFRILAGEDAE